MSFSTTRSLRISWARLVHARDGRDVGEQAAQPRHLRAALFEERRALLRSEPRIVQQSFQIPLNRCHGRFQFVVDVVRELFLDADFLLLFVQRPAHVRGRGRPWCAAGGRTAG